MKWSSKPTDTLPVLAKPPLQTTAVIKLNVVAKRVPAECGGTNEIHVARNTKGRIEYLTITFQRWWLVKMCALWEIFVLDNQSKWEYCMLCLLIGSNYNIIFNYTDRVCVHYNLHKQQASISDPNFSCLLLFLLLLWKKWRKNKQINKHAPLPPRKNKTNTPLPNKQTKTSNKTPSSQPCKKRLGSV